MDLLAQDSLSLRDFVALAPGEIVDRYGLKEEQAAAIHANEQIANDLAEVLEDRHVRPVMRGGSSYPSRLQSVLGDQAPPALFLAGSFELIHRRGVGFCGARDASEQALRCTEQVAVALAQHGLLVVSGHAQGVDETAHATALKAGGQTALVLPEGILRFRPRPSIAEWLTEDNGVIVSEFPPKVPWSVANAMQRNRTICGLVHALFVLDYANPAPSAQGNSLLLRKGGRPLPCRPGELPDLTLLLQALDLPLRTPATVQPTLFDHLTEES
jgi:predicted Rossmann fold nucleotide-binding protein DprA/Smf involved in DNA uptake